VRWHNKPRKNACYLAELIKYFPLLMTCQPILIIEDEPDLRETLKDLLEISGFKVMTASNGKEGLDHIRNAGNPCLILLDLMMPVMNGWQFLEALHVDTDVDVEPEPVQRKPSVVIVSAAADLVEVDRKYDCVLMRKPVNIHELIHLAHQHCEAAA
jgi:CheY-like chemotaxis protein